MKRETRLILANSITKFNATDPDPDPDSLHKRDNNRSDKPLTTAVNSESINSRYIELTYAENPEKSFDEARYNLATHVMSNGVELIIASEKVKYMEKQSSTSHPFKFGNGHVISTVGLQSQQQKPLTLAPSTLKNQMFLALPSVKQKQKFTIPINDNQFITKTCLTTYTYHSTYLQNGTSIVVSKESVISNRHTEERNLFQASTILQTDVILSRTPELVVGVFPTTYHYFNTILDTDHEEEDVHNALPIVITSKYTILNTVTGPEDYISYLQPSELATPTQDTNTYFSRIAFTKTLQNELDSDTPKILITENILTQVIVTESLPSRGALARKSSSAMPYSHNDTDLQIYATKTVLTTLTFYKTNLDDLNTRTALATPPVLSSQTTRQPEHANDVNKLSAQFQTRVIENIVTNTVDSSLLRPELISRFRAELLQKKGKTHPNVIVTVATLLGGQTLRITAVNAPKDPLLKPTSITKSRKRTTTAEDIKSKPTIKPSKKNSIEPYQTNDQKSHTPIQTSSIKRTRVQENLVQTQVQSHSHPSSDGDQIVAESEDKDVYVRPSSELQPSTDSMAIPVQQFLGSFDLKRLRPMLNVMANLLQKNIVNRHRTQSLSVATLPKDSIDEAKNPSITANFDGPAPVYIPLKISENGPGHFTTTILPILDGNQHAHPLSNEDRLADTSDSANVKKLTAHSLHIHPPNLQFPQLTAEENLLQQNLKNVSHYRFPFSNTADPYHSSLLSKDIPIRPGEIITANADIIIGRPGGIKIRNQEPKKMLLHTHIPLLPPPPPTNTIALVAVSGSASVSANNRINNDIVLFNKGPVSEFDNILSPPPISNYNSISGESLKFKNVIRYPGNVLSPTPAAPPIQNFRPHHGNQVYSSPQIANLNSELNNNEILEIKQIPEIFSTKLPAITSYTTFRSSYYVSPLPQTRIYQMQPTSTHKMLPSASTFSTLLKKNVLSHTVKMQAPPLTFKKDSDNFPYSTAIRGRLAHIPMPLVKIPLHEENVDVRLTPQNNRLIFLDTSAQPASQSIISPSTLKQQKQNVLHEVDNSPQGLFAQQSQQQFSTSTFRPPDKKPHNTLPTLHNQAPNDFEIPDLEMLDAHHSVSKVATNSDNIYKNRHDQVQWKNVISAHKLHHDNNDLAAEQDQRVAYTILNTAILNSQKPEVPEFIENVSPTEPYPKKWISSIKIEDLHQGKPFVLRNQTVPKLVPNSGIHKIFIAKGEHFHPHTESTTRFNQPISNSRFTTYVPSSSIVSTESRVYNPHTNVIASSPTTPYSPPYTEENILNYSLHQKTSSADKFYELSLPVNNGYSSLATSTKINTRPLQTSIFLGHSPVPATKPIIESRPNAKLRLTPNLSSTLKNLYSLMPKPTTTQTYSTINVSRSKTSKINTESHNLKKLEPSEIFEQNSQLILKTKAELITPSFASASKEKNSIHRSTYSRISSSIKLNQHPSAIPVLSPNYISKSRFDNSFQSTDVQPHKTNQDLERYNEIPLESSEFVFSSSIRHDNTPLTNRTEIAKIEPTLNPGITHHDEDTGLIQTSIHPLKTSKVKASKTSNVCPYNYDNLSEIKFNRLTSKSVVENGADIGAVDNRKGNSGHKGDSDISYEYAARDEEILPPIDSNSVLLGGVLIDSPRNPHFKTTVDNKNVPTSNELLCSPACRSSKNEICITVTSKSHCECRPGFARMFPDRPCKPTYTYELNLQTNRVGTYQLQFSDTLKGNSSNEYRHLSSIILDAVDRMVMQSDFRDIYHGVQLKSIDTDNEVSKTIVGKFLLQLSESSDLKRLETVFKKYLRQSNYSIGGTELYTSKDGINSLAIADFDECVHDNFNDCSVNAHCFNLIGSYTCSCSDGFVDVSPNAIYPGRQCSDSIIGCDKCNYNGKCVAMSGEKRDLESAATICRCFPWHAGATCQLNLKILLICLIAIGTFLLVLLLFCILLLYMRRKSRGQQTTSPIFITASTLHPNMLTSSSNKSRLSTSLINQTSPDKHAILNDSNSESSHSSLSYLHREPVGKGKKEKSNPGSFPSTNIVHRSRASPFQNTRHEAGSEHYQPTQSAFNTVEMVGDSEQTDRSLTFMIPRAKYYHPFPFRNQSDFTTFTEKAKQLKISPTATSSVRGPSLNECTTLVSAGFEVSAIVSDQMQTETHSHTNEEANTMAERDLGSTFLLPHTHLYKPERMESDISGFDSI
ncbi:uncharacterized protein Dwil_GK13615 [Drosophila willistoni]|uniref:63 kDa sperm flagellar membrane protein n=1 Tax=Drosophila willistoni TaxID=7260 RepID=A0A0Q9X1R0_DROWI|nr:uncharacterized protein Dwil_GK13615 [Drosophila willistoni]